MHRSFFALQEIERNRFVMPVINYCYIKLSLTAQQIYYMADLIIRRDGSAKEKRRENT